MDPMYKSQYFIAGCYRDAVVVLNDEIEKNKNYKLTLPVIMNQTFAIELLLKCLILFDHKDVTTESELKAKKINLHGHKLNKIYESITLEKKKIITDQWTVASKKYNVTENIIEVFSILGSEPFVEWRYVYEKQELKTMERKYLDCLLETIGESASQIIN